MSTEWWGYNPEHGWVVLFRTIPANAPGSSEDLMFIRCADAKIYREPKANWEKPKYIFAPQYLANTPAERRKFVQSEFSSHEVRRAEFEAILHKFVQDEIEAIAAKRLAASQAREAIRLERQRAAFIQSREQFFQRLGMENPGTRPIGVQRYRRITHCYHCKSPLDNAMDAECVACGWIVCTCGACGCGYQ